MTKLKKSLEDYRSTGQEFYDRLRLLTVPVAIKYIQNKDQIPDDIIGLYQPSKVGQKITLCQAFTLARRWKKHVLMTFEDNYCITSSFVNGWAEMPMKEIFQSQVISKYHKNARAEMTIQLEFAKTFGKEEIKKARKNIGFIASPLIDPIISPDVILIYGNPAQITHVIHALTFEGRNLLTGQSFMGYGESCLLGALTTYLKNKAQLVLPGEGDRTFGMTTENEMAIGIPAKKLFYINRHLFKSAGELNFGMPSKFMLLDTPFPMGPKAWSYLNRKYKKLQREKRSKSD